MLERQKLPDELVGKNIWKHRFDDINNFEEYLARNGIAILKFFLHLSKDEQKRRLLARINTPEKNWKFSVTDPVERAYWNDYMECYEDALSNTSTEHAPWYVIPADHKWFTHVVVADVIVEKLKALKMKYPQLSKKDRQHLVEAKALLENELAKKK
jgi:polyphosphate kinase 2 (PPK2 family)